MSSTTKIIAVMAVVACAALAALLMTQQPPPPQPPPPPPPVPAAVPEPPTPIVPVPGLQPAPTAPPTENQLVHCVVRRADNAQPVPRFQFMVLAAEPATSMQGKALLKDTRYAWTSPQSDDGTFTAAPLKAGEPFAIGVRAQGYQPAYQTIDPGQTRAEMWLSPETTVAGFVQSSEGAPIAGAAILLGDVAKDDIVARSGPDGSFEVTELAPGEVLLTADHPDYAPASVTVTAVKDRVTEATIVMPAGGRIEGAVTRGGQPLAKAFIIVYDAVTFAKHGKTDNAGRYVIKGVPPGAMQVECQVRVEGLAAPLTKQALVSVTLDQPATANFDFPADLGSVGGVVTVGGRPAATGMVRLASTAPDGDFFGNSPIRPDGSYLVENVPPGQITLTVTADSADGVKRATQLVLTLNAGEKIDHNVDIGGLGAIEGTIQNAAPGKNYRVLVFEGNVNTDDLRSIGLPPAATVPAGKDGTFRIDQISKGAYTVVVMAIDANADKSPQDYVKSMAASLPVTVEDDKTAAANFTF